MTDTPISDHGTVYYHAPYTLMRSSQDPILGSDVAEGDDYSADTNIPPPITRLPDLRDQRQLDSPQISDIQSPTVTNSIQNPVINGVQSAGDDDPNSSQGWLPATDLPPEPAKHRKGSILKSKARSPSPVMSNEVSGGRGQLSAQAAANTGAPRRSGSLGRANSISKRSTFTNNEGKAISGSTFINGAGTTGPNASAGQNDDMHFRAASADVSLTPKQKSKILKAEAKDGKVLSKIIKQEGKVEKQALGVAITELAELQKLQKMAVKAEAKTHTAHARTLAVYQKLETAYLAARTKYESTQAQLHAEAEALETCRNSARELTERIQEKSQEVDSLRVMMSVDEREREVKLGQLEGKKAGGSRWR